MNNTAENTLLLLSYAKNYNRMLTRMISPYLGQKILEIGSGIGTLTEYILGDREIVMTEINQKYLSYLKHHFRNYKNVKVLE